MAKKEGFVLDDRMAYRGPFSDVCTHCKHLKEPVLDEWKCKAFKDEIPEEIWFGKNDHTKEVKGDGGVRFEPRTKVDKFIQRLDILI
jgi:hypothetical protein